MKTSKILSILGFGLASLFPNVENAQAENIKFNLFPEKPIQRTIMPDPDIPRTQLQFSNQDLENILNQTPKQLLPHTSLATTFPLISTELNTNEVPEFVPNEVKKEVISDALREREAISDNLLSVSLIPSAYLDFSNIDENQLNYKARLETFINSGVVDEYLNRGNRLYLVGGYQGKGSINLEELSNKELSSIPSYLKNNTENHGFFGDIYIVPKSPYSEQFLILRAGMDNLVSKEPNFHASTTFEFPPLFHRIDSLENFDISPYVSLYITSDRNEPTIGEIGLKLSGESDKQIFGYARAEYNDNSEESLDLYTGIKASF